MRKVGDGVKLPNTCAECSLPFGEGEKKNSVFCTRGHCQTGAPLAVPIARKDVRRELCSFFMPVQGSILSSFIRCLEWNRWQRGAAYPRHWRFKQQTDRQTHLALSRCIAHAGPVSLVKGNERVPLKRRVVVEDPEVPPRGLHYLSCWSSSPCMEATPWEHAALYRLWEWLAARAACSTWRIGLLGAGVWVGSAADAGLFAIFFSRDKGERR